MDTLIPRFKEGCKLVVKERLLWMPSRIMFIISIFWVGGVSKIQFHPTIAITML